MTSNPQNAEAIEKFSATVQGKALEEYLKKKAWEADSKDETRVYLVKDETDSIALFFSIKCGLLYKKYQYDQLDEDKRSFVNLLIDAYQKDSIETLREYYASEMYPTLEMDDLFVIAQKRIELKKEEKEIHDEKYALKVDECFPAVEMQHFCKNSSYKMPKNAGTPLGFGIFWEVIVPFVCGLSEQIGCKYLYLFAADNTSESEVRKLVQYYKSELKFRDIEDMMIIKPWYDKDCLGLVQEIRSLKLNREAVWEEFSDVNNENI